MHDTTAVLVAVILSLRLPGDLGLREEVSPPVSTHKSYLVPVTR